MKKKIERGNRRQNSAMTGFSPFNKEMTLGSSASVKNGTRFIMCLTLPSFSKYARRIALFSASDSVEYCT